MGKKKEKEKKELKPVAPVEGVEAKLEDVDIDYLEKGFKLPGWVRETLERFMPSALTENFSMDAPTFDEKSQQFRFNLYKMDGDEKKVHLKINVGVGKDHKHTLKFSGDYGNTWHVLLYQKTTKSSE